MMDDLTRRGVLKAASSVGAAATFGLAARASAAPKADEDCLGYNPQNLTILVLSRKGSTSYTVRDGSHWIISFPSFTDAQNAMAYMRRFNTICFEGRGTDEIRTWFETRNQ